MTPSPSTTTPAGRLHSLEGFLQHDPHNQNLLAHTFDAALAAGDLARAESLLGTAREQGYSTPAWTFRAVNLLLARKRPQDARDLLLELQVAQGEHPAVAHNLAYCDFIQGDYAACSQRLRPWVDGTEPLPVPLDVPQLAALQVLWLRAMHRQTLLDEAWAWVQAQLERNNLSAPAAGVASLLAVDADHMESVKVLAEAALAQDPLQMEALVARATIALAERDVTLARKLLDAALRHNAVDGRTLSALGFTELLSSNLPQARHWLEQSVSYMPGHIGTWIGLGWTRFLQQDLAGARQCFEHALALDRNFGESHGSLAVVQALAGERDDARLSIDRALGLDKSNLSARYAQALLAGEAGDAQAIHRLARRLLGGRAAPLGGDLAGWLPPQE